MRNKYVISIVIILSLLLSPLAWAASYPSNIYTVVTKDTLGKIAVKYSSTVQELKTLNGLQTDILLIGQKLSVPITYTVIPGDTLWKVASAYKTSVQQIKATNKLSTDALYVGQKLRIAVPVSNSSVPVVKLPASSLCQIEDKMKSYGLVDVQTIDPTIRVDLKYSSTDNFLKTDAYECLTKAFLQKDAAIMLGNAQKYLKEQAPGHSLLVYDAARPLSVQQKMWDMVKGTEMQSYVANPVNGSMHNYGTAVDITIVDSKGVPLDMGTPFDYLGSLAQPKLEQEFLAQGKLTQKQVANRELLRYAMHKAGYKVISNEWWHFNAFPQDWVRKNLVIIP